MFLFRAFSLAVLFVGVSAKPGQKKAKPLPNYTIAECKTECDDDFNCLPGLLCADSHERELAAAGYDKQKAYCGNIGKSNFDVCYDPKKLGKVPNIVVPYTPPNPLKKECQADCDLDIDCEPGLLCADEHTRELVAKGLHPRFVTCTNRRGVPANFEMCFKKEILCPTGKCGGDPHFRTFDGTKYTYHGECDLVMARSRSFGNDLGLDLHIRTAIVTDWSLISNAALRIGEDTFELTNDGSYYFNGAKNVEFPIHLAGKYEVTKAVQILGNSTRPNFSIKLDNDTYQINLNLFKGMIAVKVDAWLDGTEGMMGIHGISGMISRDHQTVLSDVNMMGAEWQVRDNEPMLFHDIRAPQFPVQCTLPTVQSRRLRERDQTFAEEACAGVDAEMFEFCVHDVVLTGDIELALGYAY